MIRLCLHPQCASPAIYRGRCQAHARVFDRQTNRAGYHLYRSKRWKHTRARYLFDHPLCETDGCERIATDVHHIRDLAEGGEPHNPANLEALCGTHHARITRSRQVA